MVNPNWGIATQPNGFQNAFSTGVQMGQMAREREAQNALSKYAMNPNDPQNQESLARNAPKIAMQETEKRQELAKQERFRALRTAALTGNKEAAMILAAEDNAAYNSFNAEQRAQSDQADKAMAQAVFQLEQLPEDQRAARWDAIAAEAAPELVGKYSPVAIDVILSKGGVAKAYQEFKRPSIGFVPADSLAYGKNAAGSAVLGASGQPTSQPAAQPQGGPQEATYASPEQVATLKASMGERAAMEYLNSHGIAAVEAIKEVGGKQYYQINGQWFEN